MQKPATLASLALAILLHGFGVTQGLQGQSEPASAADPSAIASSAITPRELLSKARIASSERDHERAIELLSELLSRPSPPSIAYYLRGRARLCDGDFMGSVKDFDAYVQQVPEVAARLWERGIACYYAGQYDAGAQQFSRYQSFDGNDVENAVWHVLCRASVVGFDEASSKIMNVRQDARVPMREVFELFAGRGSTQEVLERAEREPEAAGRRHRSLFYAHLYLGLYHEAKGNAALALQHLHLATHKYPIDNTMWDVAKIHLETRQAEASRSVPPSSEAAP